MSRPKLSPTTKSSQKINRVLISGTFLTQRAPNRKTCQSAPFWDVPEQPGEDPDEGDHNYGYDYEGEETLTGPSRRRPRRNVLNDHYDEEDNEDAYNTPESSAEHALFITQPDPEPYHEPGTLSQAQKGKTPDSRKRGKLSTNIWASFGLTTNQGGTSATNVPPAAKRPTAVRGRGPRGTTRGTTRGRTWFPKISHTGKLLILTKTDKTDVIRGSVRGRPRKHARGRLSL